MAISYANTIEIENISKELITLANDLNTEFNNLFARFANVPTETKEWVGKQSMFYFELISHDKKEYTEFASKIRDIGYKLNKDVYEIQTCINKNNNAENQKGD